MLRIKRNDRVMVISGNDKGKIGKVIRVFPSQNRLVVENVNVAKKTKRKSQKDPQGGFIDFEMPIHISNVMLVDKQTNKPTRFGASILKDGGKVRLSKKTGETV